jgi:uncharacterized protein YciI
VGAGRIAVDADQKPLKDMLAGLLHKQLYVAITEPGNSPEIEQSGKLREHILSQIDLERRGILFGAGPIQDEGDDRPSKGMFIIRASSFEEARAILDKDPFHAAGLRTYKLQRWSLNEGSITMTVNYSDQSVVIT